MTKTICFPFISPSYKYTFNEVAPINIPAACVCAFFSSISSHNSWSIACLTACPAARYHLFPISYLPHPAPCVHSIHSLPDEQCQFNLFFKESSYFYSVYPAFYFVCIYLYIIYVVLYIVQYMSLQYVYYIILYKNRTIFYSKRAAGTYYFILPKMSFFVFFLFHFSLRLFLHIFPYFLLYSLFFFFFVTQTTIMT